MFKHIAFIISITIHFGAAYALISNSSSRTNTPKIQKPIIVSLATLPNTPSPKKSFKQENKIKLHPPKPKQQISELKKDPSNESKTIAENITQPKENKTNHDLDTSYEHPIYKIGTNDNPRPKYPHLALRKKQQGKVVICVDISNKGIANNASICSSSGHRMLDVAALKTIKKWKFQTASLNLETSATKIKVPITFSLKDA